MSRALVVSTVALTAFISYKTFAIDTEASGYKLLNGGTLSLTPSHSPAACRTFVNNSGSAQFIATKTASEWASVIANPPASVSSNPCGVTLPSIVQTATATSGAGGTTNLNLGFASNCTVGNTVVVGVMGRLSSDTVTAMSGLGGTWMKATSASQTANNIEIWRAKCASAGTLVSITTGNTNIRVNIGLEVANIGTIANVIPASDLGADWGIDAAGYTPTVAPTFIFLAGVVDKQATTSGHSAGTPAGGSQTVIQTPIAIDAGSGGSRVTGGAMGAVMETAQSGYSFGFTFSGTGSPTSTGIAVVLQ